MKENRKTNANSIIQANGDPQRNKPRETRKPKGGRSMSKRFFQPMLGFLSRVMAGIALAMILFNPAVVPAATNQAIDEGTGGLTLSASGNVTVTSTQLGLVKAVFDTSGNCLASSDSDAACNATTSTAVLTGTELVFVVYVDNTTTTNATDVRFQDDIDDVTADYFEFQSNEFGAGQGITIATGIATAATKATIWTALTGGTALTNAFDGGAAVNEYCGIDTAVSPDQLICGGDAVSPDNDQVDIANSTITAVKFHVIKRD